MCTVYHCLALEQMIHSTYSILFTAEKETDRNHLTWNNIFTVELSNL